MTKEEIEIYNEMRDEAQAEQAEQDRQTAEMFQEQQNIQPDYGQEMQQYVQEQEQVMENNINI